MQEKNEHQRPYWHVDMKWIFGILSTFLLLITLILSILTNLTSEETAIPLGTLIVASQFSRDGLDDPKDIEEAKRKFLSSGEDVFYPLGDKNVSITKTDLETLSPRELRLKIFRQVVEPYYYLGAEGVANQMTQDSQKREEIKKQAGVLGFINQKTHEQLFRFFLISLIPLLLSLSGLVFFSYQYGRLISPAVVFLLVSTLPAILLFLIQVLKPPLDAQGRSEGLSFLPYETIQEIAAALSPPYYLLFLTGVGLTLIIVVLKIVKRFTKKPH